MKKTLAPFLWIGVLLAILTLAPLFVSSYYVGLLTMMLIYGIFAMSLDILTGYGGMPSLGHAAFFGVSAYIVAVMNVMVYKSFALEMAAGLAAAVVVGAIFGLLSLRSKGIYFIMIVVALSMLLWGLASKLKVTGGDDGFAGITRHNLSPILWDLGPATNYYFFVLIVFAIALILMYLLVRSSFGITLLGIKQNETRMSTLGYNTWAYKYFAFIVSGLFGGLAGILIVYYNRFISPVDLSTAVSAEVLLMVILGGAGTLFGPLLGAAVIIFLENLISSYTDRWTLILGAIYVFVILFAPQGIYGWLRGWGKRLGLS